MSEITKLYKNAGVGKQKYYACKRPDYSDVFEEKLPPFTPEKQLSLIKWLMTNNKDYQYNVEDSKYWFIIDDYRETKYREFDESLAELINLYWQSLTEEERKQIADILRG